MKTLRRTAINSVRRWANFRGIEVVPLWKIPELPLANHLREIFKEYHIDTVLDVGANKGQYRDMLRNDVGFEGKILSFEPVSKYAKMIKSRSQSDKSWKVYEFALGSTPGSAKINVMESPGLNSFLSPRTDEVPGFWKENPIVQEETVQIRTLDDVLAQEGIDCSKQGVYLKLDTQGFDLEVVKGGPVTLKHIKAMQTEASVRPIYSGMPTYLEAINNITECGFNLSSMFPVTYDGKLRVIELDCVFVRGD